jgi:hypothetical protein
MRGPLADLVNWSKATSRAATADGKPFMEECGLFLFLAEDWTPGLGWQGKIVYQHMENKSRHEGGFVMDNDEVARVLGEAISRRASVVEEVCTRYGWHPYTPWTLAFHEHASAEFERSHEDVSYTVEQKAAAVYEYMRQEQLDLAQGWNKKALGYLALGPVTDPRLTAAEWLMVRGISVLAGLGHSHPSGNADLSPEDYLATTTVEHWKKVFQARFVHLGQEVKSELELSRSVGNWIYGMPERVDVFDASVAALGANLNPGTLLDEIRVGPNAKPGAINDFRFVGDSTISRYDGRGKRGEWSGPF